MRLLMRGNTSPNHSKRAPKIFQYFSHKGVLALDENEDEGSLSIRGLRCVENGLGFRIPSTTNSPRELVESSTSGTLGPLSALGFMACGREFIRLWPVAAGSWPRGPSTNHVRCMRGRAYDGAEARPCGALVPSHGDPSSSRRPHPRRRQSSTANIYAWSRCASG